MLPATIRIRPSQSGPPNSPDRRGMAGGAPDSEAQRRSLTSPASRTGPCVNWLFVDLNSYFASVEQQVRPELRGRPVAVVPMMADTTCCIAASYEAKAFGVRTGTIVADAKHMCPDIVLVEGRHEIYTEYHHRIVEAVESCLPVTAVLLHRRDGLPPDGPRAPAAGRHGPRHARSRHASASASAPCCAAPSAWPPTATWPKSPATWKSPTAWWRCRSTFCPKRCASSPCATCPASARELRSASTRRASTPWTQLLALDCEQAGELWGSVWGERLWHWLRGEDFDMAETEHLKSISHSARARARRCAPRKKPGPWPTSCCTRRPCACAPAICGPAASAWPSALPCRAAEKAPVSRFGVPTRGWHDEIRLSECQDNPTLIAALRRLWESRPSGQEYDQPYFIGVQLNGLVPDRLHSLNLFDALDGEQSRTRLLGSHGRAQQQVRPEHAGPRHHAQPPTKPRPRASPSTAFPSCSNRARILDFLLGIPTPELFPPNFVTLCIPIAAFLRIRE